MESKTGCISDVATRDMFSVDADCVMSLFEKSVTHSVSSMLQAVHDGLYCTGMIDRSTDNHMTPTTSACPLQWSAQRRSPASRPSVLGGGLC